MAALDTAARNIERAIRDKGPAPYYHDDVMAKHRKEWPVLWKALDELLAALRGK